MAKFDATRIASAAVPELLIASLIALGNLGTRALDAKAGRVKALTQWNTWFHGAVMVTGGYFVGTGTKEATGKTMMVADMVPITDRLAAPAIEEAVGVRIKGPGRREIQDPNQRLITEGQRPRIRQTVVPEMANVRIY